VFGRVQAIDRLLYERPALTNTSIDLLGQDLEAFIAEDYRFTLSRLRQWRDNGQVIARVQRDGFGDHAHITFKMVESGVHVIELIAEHSFHRRGGIHELLESRLNKHALADARSVASDVEPTRDAFAQPDRHLATRHGFAPSRRLNVNVTGLPVQFGQLLHALITPKAP
jgi:hypothetical protein